MTFAWVAIHVFLGVSFVLLGTVRRAGEEYTLFGLLALVGGTFALATGLHYALADGATGWASVRIAAGVTFAAIGLDLATRLAGTRVRLRYPVLAGYGYAVTVIGMLALGWCFSGQIRVRQVDLGLFDLTYREAALNLVGRVALAPVPVIALATTWILVRAALRGARWVWPVAISQGVLTVAAVHDIAASLGAMRSPYLVEHATFVFVFGVSYSLLARLAERAAVSAEELHRSRETLAAVRNTLAQREPLAMVGELSAIVAHEIRNPLGVITNAAASLRRPELPATDRSLLLQIVGEECDRLNRIVTDMLALARPLDLQRRPVDLRDLVTRSLGPARRERTAVELEVRFASGTEDPLLCDGNLLRQALENVVDNAVQAMDAGGTLTVVVAPRVRAGRRGREIAVVDSGEGMNTEVRNRATHPFFTTRTTGTGLGLAIVDRILAAHGGAVDIESARGAGTTVRLFVPEE